MANERTVIVKHGPSKNGRFLTKPERSTFSSREELTTFVNSQPEGTGFRFRFDNQRPSIGKGPSLAQAAEYLSKRTTI